MSNPSASTSDEPPLRFHAKRTQNIRVTHDGTIARRCSTAFFTRGLVFGTRPVKVDEKVTFKVTEVAENLGGFVYVGFTSRDPESMTAVSCQKLAKDSGYWSWFFPKDLIVQGRGLFFYVASNGEVHYGVDGAELGVLGVVKPTQQVWPLFDIFGNSAAIRLVDPKPVESSTKRKLTPLMLHSVHSRNVRVDKNVAQRLDTRYSQGFVFSGRPVRANENITIKISPNQTGSFKGYIYVGVTSCDPQNLNIDELPDNVNELVDRSEYWVVLRDFAKLQCGDEIHVTLTSDGPIEFEVTGGKFKGVVHVDATLKLWVFVNVYGSTQAVHLATEQTKVEEKECVVCYDNAIEAALYRCGHTCMCFECAVEQWQGKGDGHCPICRAVIRDVIRINK